MLGKADIIILGLQLMPSIPLGEPRQRPKAPCTQIDGNGAPVLL